jgi:hypothetical protein
VSSTKIFDFSANALDKAIEELVQADKYIRIAVFQIHSDEIFEALEQKLRDGVRIDILTLPYDSINEELRLEVTSRFEKLNKNGATLYFCKWNVGDPRTQTATGRWYSFHGKFIVTDKSAISLSANFTKSKEVDGVLIFKNDPEKVQEYNRKFEYLLELFVRETAGYDGTIRSKIMATGLPNVERVFDLPKRIETTTHVNHWIQHYPASLCHEDAPLENGLYIAPFDCRGRNFIEKVIANASEFSYISTETFTDDDIPGFLIKIKMRGVDVRVITGAASMDYQQKVGVMLRELLAQEIGIKTTESDLHAKLVITDKHLIVSSINLNQINLGFKYPTKQYWRGNTETIVVVNDRDIIQLAKDQFLQLYDTSKDIQSVLSEKIETLVGLTLNRTFGLSSKKEVKSLFARFIIKKEIEVKGLIVQIGKIVARLLRTYKRDMVEKDDFISALVLYYLSERKHDFNELNDKLKLLNEPFDLSNILGRLTLINFIEKAADYYKLKAGD